MERYYTIPMEVGLSPTPGVDIIRSTSFYGLSFVRVTFRYGIDYYFAVTQAALALQQNVSLPNNVSAANPGLEPGRRNLSLPGGRPAEFRADQSAHHPGLGVAAPLPDGAGHRSGQYLGRNHQGIRGRSRSAQARRLQHHPAPGDFGDRKFERQCRRSHHQFRPAIGQCPRRRPDRQRRNRRFDPGLQGQRHREHFAGAVQRRAHSSQGRGEGLRRQCAAARQGRPRQ